MARKKSPHKSPRLTAQSTEPAATASAEPTGWKLADCVQLAPFALAVGWLLLRVLVFFWIAWLYGDPPAQLTLPPLPFWAIILAGHGAFVLLALLCQYREPLLLLASSVLAALSLFLELAFLPWVFGPGADLGAWLSWINTLDSRSRIERQVAVTPVEEAGTFRGTRYRHRHAGITDVGADSPAFVLRTDLPPQQLTGILCIDEHIGALGWRWVGNLHPCPLPQ